MNPLPRLTALLQRHPFAVDVILASVLCLIPFILTRTSEIYASLEGRNFLFVVGSHLLGIAIALRRRLPVHATCAAVLGLTAVIPSCLTEFNDQIVALQIMVLLHSAASLGSTLVRRGSLGLFTAAALFAAASREPVYGGSARSAFVFTLLLGLSAWAFGDMARSRRSVLESAQIRARQLETEAAQERELAARDERARIAREMHDIVAHSLAVIVTQADGGRYAAAKDPAIAPRTLEVVAATARDSLAQMRSLLGVLRTDDSPAYHAAPDLSGLPGLLESARVSGIDAVWREEGADGRSRLAPGAELVLYRAAQEMLTNVVKHAGEGARARLVIAWGARTVRLSCESEPAPQRAGLISAGLDSAGSRGTGLGLAGMRERAALYSGTLRAGPTERGFLASLTLPYAAVLRPAAVPPHEGDTP